MNSSNCTSQFGNPDATGIGVRIGFYVTVLQVIFFYSVASKTYARLTLLQMLFFLGGTHFAVFLSMLGGTLDPYTLTVVIHQALLITGAQFIHLLTFQRKSWHRRLYVTNTLVLLAEFMLSNFWPAWINRNSNYCPQLTETISAAGRERQRWTVFLLILSFLLSLLDWASSTIDTIRNKDIDRTKGDHSIPTLPRCILWDRDLWNRRRVAYLTFGVSLYLLSIFNLEFKIIRYFHETAQQVGGLSTEENRWGFGQMVAIFVGPVTFLCMLRNYLIDKSAGYAKKTKKVKAGIEIFANDGEKRRVAFWTWIYSRLTHKQPRIRRGNALLRPAYSSDNSFSANGASATSRTTVHRHSAQFNA